MDKHLRTKNCNVYLACTKVVLVIRYDLVDYLILVAELAFVDDSSFFGHHIHR